MEWNINTKLAVDYRIKISEDVLSPLNDDIAVYSNTGDGASNRRLVAVDKKVMELYRERIESYFQAQKLNAHFVILDGIESKKNTDSLFMLLHEMENFNVDRRNESVISLGGGVVADLVGFAASIYRRGVSYIRVPTTLLGIVDVSIAAKTGLNWEGRRNRLGSYYPPVCSLLDKTFIKTQESIEISSGLGEVLKMAVIKDAHLFALLEDFGKELLESKFSHVYADNVIIQAVEGMKEELENNLWERNLKRCVDFGHSFSPTIEMRSLATDNPMTHGQAVTIDIILSCIISKNRGMLSVKDFDRIISTTQIIGLKTFHPLFSDTSLILEALNDIVKHRAGNQNLPLPTNIGKYIFINDLSFEEILSMVDEFKKINIFPC